MGMDEQKLAGLEATLKSMEANQERSETQLLSRIERIESWIMALFTSVIMTGVSGIAAIIFTKGH